MKIQPKDYIPPKSNSIYVYKCTNNERFTFKRYIEYFNDDKIQVRYDNGINSFINVYKYADDGIKLCYYTNISSYHQQFQLHDLVAYSSFPKKYECELDNLHSDYDD